MPNHALLEISLAPGRDNLYNVELRYDRPGDRLESTRASGTASFDLESLFDRRLDPHGYGVYLAQSLFAAAAVRSLFHDAWQETVINRDFDALRIRIYIDALDSPLHNVLWETLVEPENESWLLVNERVLFSRYLGRGIRQSVRLSPSGTLRVLVCAANPRELLDETQQYEENGRRLYPVRVEEEVERARRALAPVEPDVLKSDPKQPGIASLKNLTARLREGYDVLFLLCHGALKKSDPQTKSQAMLWLDEEKMPSRIPGKDFVDALTNLLRPPLVVLASCQSAGTGQAPRQGDDGAMAALGPALARAGIPAIVAMQGNVSMETIAEFMPPFFTALRQHGQIDQAMAIARIAVQKQPDAWMPVLFLALKEGRVWANPGEPTGLPGFDKWTKLLESIQAGECVMVLGSALSEPVLGSQQQIARAWAQDEGLPLTENGREDMPHVAQFIATMQEPDTLTRKWLETMRGDLSRRNLVEVPDAERDLDIDTLIETIGNRYRADFPDAPHVLLARLPFKIFVTTANDDLLTHALRAANKKPVIELCRWHPGLDGLPSIYQREERYTPSERRPLVYHLLGHLDYPSSLVLTEDHYLDFLTRIRTRDAQIPLPVELALRTSPLLLLGFQADDWDFRVLFRSIAIGRMEKLIARNQSPSVAVQLSPDDRFRKPALAVSYLQKYFGVANVEISWGCPEDFARELWYRWKGRAERSG